MLMMCAIMVPNNKLMNPPISANDTLEQMPADPHTLEINP